MRVSRKVMSAKSRLFGVGLSIVSLAFASDISAQTVQEEVDKAKASLLNAAGDAQLKNVVRMLSVDRLVSESAATSALGISSSTVISPKTPDEFAAGLINGFDPNGNFQNGIAMDFNPALLFFGDDITTESYRNGPFTSRLFTNTQISVATTKSDETEDNASRLAIGVQVTPWIQNDPRLDLEHQRCVGLALVPSPRSEAFNAKERKLVPQLARAQRELKNAKNQFTEKFDAKSQKRVADSEAKLQNIVQALRKLREDSNEFDQAIKAARKSQSQCIAEFKERTPDSGGWTLGITPTWLSKDSDLDDLEYTGATLWSSFSRTIGVGSKNIGKLGVHIRYRDNELTPVQGGNNQFFERDVLSMAGKFSFDGTKSPLNGTFQDSKFSFEGAYFDADAEGTSNDDTYYQLSGSAHFHLPKVGENIWLALTFGKSYGREGSDESFGKAAFNWAFNDKSKGVMPK